MRAITRQRFWIWGVVLATLVAGGELAASELSVPNQFQAGEPAVAAEVNANFSAVEQAVNDNDARVDQLEQTTTSNSDRISQLESAGSELTRIQYLSWVHDGTVTLNQLQNLGVVVSFTDQIQMHNVGPPVVELYWLNSNGVWERFSDFDIQPVEDVDVPGDSLITDFIAGTPGTDVASGFAIVPTSMGSGPQFGYTTGLYKLVVRGDFLADIQGRAVDADFVLADLPTGDRLAGGTFESWFEVSN